MRMNGTIRKYWIRALKGSAGAYRTLGMLFLLGKTCKKDRRLARLCLQKAMEMGDETAYFLYHREFSGNKKVIDDMSYKKMWEEFKAAKNPKEKKRLVMYLNFGTKAQKKMAHNNRFTL